MAHFQPSAGFPVPLPSEVATLDKASAAVRQKCQAKAVNAGIPWGRQRGAGEEHTGGGSTEGRHQDQVPGAMLWEVEWTPS